MLDRAVITDTLTVCAASISSTSSGSFCCCHHCDKLARLPLCGNGAYHCAGAAMGILAGGPLAARLVQPLLHCNRRSTKKRPTSVALAACSPSPPSSLTRLPLAFFSKCSSRRTRSRVELRLAALGSSTFLPRPPADGRAGRPPLPPPLPRPLAGPAPPPAHPVVLIAPSPMRYMIIFDVLM